MPYFEWSWQFNDRSWNYLEKKSWNFISQLLWEPCHNHPFQEVAAWPTELLGQLNEQVETILYKNMFIIYN